MQYIILDLEATCWNFKQNFRREIIEIGAVRVMDDNTVRDEFNEFVKPALHPKLSGFCKRLTSISQDKVDEADPFPLVLERFLNWIHFIDDDYILGSWGQFDRKQLTSDCLLYQKDVTWLEKHFSVKHDFSVLKEWDYVISLDKAIKLEELEFEGTHHRAIDDAWNVVHIFRKYFGEWPVQKKLT